MRKLWLFIISAIFISLFSISSDAVTLGDNLKEGDLISASDYGDPDIFIINSFGYKRLFLNPVIFNFYGHLGGFHRVKKVTPEVRDSYVTSGLFRNCEISGGKVYGVEITEEDKGNLHWVNTPGEQAVKDDADFFKKVFCINNREFGWYPKSTVYSSVKQVPDYTRIDIPANPTEITATSTPGAQASKPASIPPSLENSCAGFKIKRTDIMATATQIGAGWVTMANAFRWDMVEPEKGVYDFARTDEVIKKAQENNLALLVEMVPYAKWDQGNDASCAGKPNEYMCKPKDMTAYKKALSATIERYDGDGQKDMPGLKFPIKYWQIINEADIKDRPYVIFFVGGPGDYLEVLKESYETIKEACSDCKVLVGAAASVRSEAISFWGNVFDLGGANYFDIANVHYVGLDVAGGGTVSLGDAATLNVSPYKNLLESKGIKKPIWVSEAVLQSSNARAWLKGALTAGASKVFFVGYGVEESSPAGIYSSDFSKITDECPSL